MELTFAIYLCGVAFFMLLVYIGRHHLEVLYKEEDGRVWAVNFTLVVLVILWPLLIILLFVFERIKKKSE